MSGEINKNINNDTFNTKNYLKVKENVEGLIVAAKLLDYKVFHQKYDKAYLYSIFKKNIEGSSIYIFHYKTNKLLISLDTLVDVAYEGINTNESINSLTKLLSQL